MPIPQTPGQSEGGIFFFVLLIEKLILSSKAFSSSFDGTESSCIVFSTLKIPLLMRQAPMGSFFAHQSRFQSIQHTLCSHCLLLRRAESCRLCPSQEYPPRGKQEMGYICSYSTGHQIQILPHSEAGSCHPRQRLGNSFQK